MIRRQSSLILFAVVVLVSGCTKLAQRGAGFSVGNNPAFIEDTTFYTHEVKNISIATLTANGNADPEIEMSISVDTSLSGYSPLTAYCGTSGANPCKCEMIWTELNTVGGGSTSVERRRTLDSSEVQGGQIKCRFTQDFWNEIASGTSIRVNIVPGTGNSTGLSVKAKGYKKGTTSTANGDFLDDTLTPFRNIHRYTCFSKRAAPHEILNQYATSTDSNSQNPVNLLIASRFCAGQSNTGTQCATPRNGYSAQSYYRNLYVRSDKMGEINSTNPQYDCPKVVESIRYSAQTPSSNIPSSEKGKYWPLDTTFALATEYSSEWSVGVRAGTILNKDGDSNSVSDACVNEDTSKRLLERGIIIKCLGYAKRPKPNGTCGQITDNNGRVRPMVRLRRYRVIYPGTFQANGQVDAGPVEADEVYVADRLVVTPTGVPTGAMIYGPKPCNYAWFDHEGVVNRNGTSDFGSNLQNSGAVAGFFAQPSYVATSNYFRSEGGESWSVNPDGLIFPRFDRDGTFGSVDRPFCSATLPRVEEVMGTPAQLRLLTSHQSRTDRIRLGAREIFLREVHIKPIDPWTPNYVEDLSFQACVPVADPYVEPPMHFYKKDNDTMAWCSKVYPTQNPFWLDLNAKKKPPSAAIPDIAVNWNGGAGPAPVEIYTSHENTGAAAADHYLDARNSCSGTQAAEICLMSLGSTAHPNYMGCVTYLDTAPGRQTCDRTVVFDANQAHRGFPLQAKDADVSAMLASDLDADRSYSCQYSVHPDSSKIGKRMPLTGCCGLATGGVPVLSNVLSTNGRSGHLEPQVVPTDTNLRYCGNPIDVP